MARPKKVQKAVTPKKEKKRFGVIFNVNDIQLFGHGDTLKEAMLEAKPSEFLTFCEIAAVDNETKKEATAVYNVQRMKAFYDNPTVTDIVCDYLLTQMKE